MPLVLRRGWAGALRNLLLFLLILGPWPARDEPFEGTEFARATLSRMAVSPGKPIPGPVWVGMAEVDLGPPAGVATPTAGFIGSIARPIVAVNSSCHARALTVAGRSASVTILAADLLLVDDRLARAVLARAGLPREQVYFTATHTHGGPGAWGIHPLERLVAGTYDPEAFGRLADRLAEAVVRSRARLDAAEVAFVRVDAPGLQRNRIEPDAPTDDSLSAWVFRSPTPLPGRPGPRPALATLASFGAHATIARPWPPRLGADYPGAFVAALPGLVDSGLVLFAAGAVGDAGPVRPDVPGHQAAADAYGRQLAGRLAGAIAGAEFRAEAELDVRGLDVDLMPVQYPIGGPRLRLSPLATWWMARPRTYLQAVRLGPAVLVGFPGDYAGHLARRLRGTVPVVATSFDGDYKGYLTSAATFQAISSYETRRMSFFGPHLGDYLTDLAQRRVDQLAPPRP